MPESKENTQETKGGHMSKGHRSQPKKTPIGQSWNRYKQV